MSSVDSGQLLIKGHPLFRVIKELVLLKPNLKPRASECLDLQAVLPRLWREYRMYIKAGKKERSNELDRFMESCLFILLHHVREVIHSYQELVMHADTVEKSLDQDLASLLASLDLEGSGASELETSSKSDTGTAEPRDSLIYSLATSVPMPLPAHLDYDIDSHARLHTSMPQRTPRPKLRCSSSSASSSSSSSSPNGDAQSRPKRANYPKAITRILRSWLESHLQRPYPSEMEKLALSSATGLDLTQINNWFINARRRIVPHLKRK